MKKTGTSCAERLSHYLAANRMTENSQQWLILLSAVGPLQADSELSGCNN